MRRPLVWLALAALGCTGNPTPKPLPGGPPPEYEAPRAFDAGAAAKPAEPEAPPAPVAPPTSAAPATSAAPSPPHP